MPTPIYQTPDYGKLVMSLPDIATEYQRAMDTYENCPHIDTRRWERFIDVIRAQFDALIACGISIYYADSPSWHRTVELMQKRVILVSMDGSLIDGHPLNVALAYPLVRNVDYMRATRYPITANAAFRAVHDWYGHMAVNAGIDPEGEVAAYLEHKRWFPTETHDILFAETIGQLAYHADNGFVSKQLPIELYPWF